MRDKTFNFISIFLFLFSHALLFAYHQKGYQYVSPAPHAKQASRYSKVLIRLSALSPGEIQNIKTFIEVSGSESGRCYGETAIAGDERTIIFKPFRSFAPGETVHVRLAPHVTHENETRIESFQFQFEISELEHGSAVQNEHNNPSGPALQKTESSALLTAPRIAANGVSIPSDFPQFTIGINDNPDQGYIFLSKKLYQGPFYHMILDNSGCPVWYLKTPGEGSDFKVQQNSLLTMWIGGDFVAGKGYIGFDRSYTVVDSFYAVDGYFTDEHELIVLEDGHYLLIGIREIELNQNPYFAGIVRETVIQEFTASGELIFLWSPWDHFDIRDIELDDLSHGYVSFPHMNALSIDDDGHILLSSRHLSEVTKINRQTGDIIWRLGGAHNQFTFVNDPLNGFTNQHDIRSLGNGRYTVYDNGNSHPNQESRAVEYELDLDAMTATLVWQLQHSPPLFSYWMGNVQRLPNGNTLVNWSEESDVPVLTEVRPNGTKAFELWQMANNTYYRSFRFPWNGNAEKPYLLVEGDEKVTLLFNKFGDSDVDYYRIYSGTTPNPTALLDTSRLTLKQFDDFEKGIEYYFRVTAVDKSGQESAYSNEVSNRFDPVEPGENLVKDGDFANYSALANWNFYSNYSASVSIDDGICHVHIENGGVHETLTELTQAEIRMIKGKTYLFEFDAWADDNRKIDANILSASRYPNYSKLGSFYLDTRHTHFAYSFMMEEETDLNALLTFYLGNSNHDVYLDNISLTLLNESDVQQSSCQALSEYKLLESYPNPFNATTKIQYTIPKPAWVSLKIFNLAGQEIVTLVNGRQSAGVHAYEWNTTGLPSGIYFYRLHAGEFMKTKKLILQK